MSTTILNETETNSRNKLKTEKPLVYEKIIKYDEKYARGEAIPIVDIQYDYSCNLKCKHCLYSNFEKRTKTITPEVIKDFANQMDALGLAQICISGGEPLIFKDLEEIFKAIGPERFHIAMSTNGMFMTFEKAKQLKTMGLDKVKISIDSIVPELHDSNRAEKGTYNKAVEALFNAKKAGLSVVAQHCATHQTVRTENMEKLAMFCQENGFALDILVARALGRWEGNHEVLIDKDDAEHLCKLHEKYPVLHRDTFPSYGMNKGCGTVKHVLGLTKYGDILPCVYIHISIGNIFEESLKDIIDRGLKIRHFNEHNPLCLSGEDRNFINNYMTKFYGKPLPISWKEAFSDEDFIK